MLAKAFVLAVMAAAVCARASDNSSVPAWPDQFITIQMQYWAQSGDAIQKTVWYYDYANLRHRLDHTMVDPGTGIGKLLPKNNTEFWIGTDLYMYDFDKNTCTHLDMGFGIPRPDWFLTGAEELATQWLYRDEKYRETRQMAKPAPYSPFNYYSYADTGVAFRLEAPGPTGRIVVNDFYDFRAETPPPSLFQLPANIQCTDGSAKQLPEHASVWVNHRQ